MKYTLASLQRYKPVHTTTAARQITFNTVIIKILLAKQLNKLLAYNKTELLYKEYLIASGT